jgi:hypothetical protein
LLAEYLPDASGFQIAKLSLKPGALFQRRCPCVFIPAFSPETRF